MGRTPLLAEPFLDDDEDVNRVQRFAGAGARAGARLGAVGGPVGAGVGAGFGSAAGYLVGYGLTGVGPAEQLDEGVSHSHVDGDEAMDGGEPNATHDSGGGDHGHDDGPITIDVTDEG
ncbi:hypothetical protein [Halorientalis marina]|uniref:hypothetical protein n=1 Tax=Halorientalis marina TaxID=2931976 RepID=UPI001FF6B968|nr:hypothetical protein [Halorientalis marina]